LNKTILLLAIASANSSMALRAVEPMLPALADEFGISVPVASIVMVAYAMAYGTGQLLHGGIGDRLGKLRVVTVCIGLSALCSIGCAFSYSLPSLAGWRMATGALSSAAMILGMAYIGDVVPMAQRQLMMARYIAGSIIGQSLGPAVGGVFTDLFGWRSAFGFHALVFAAVALLLYSETRRYWDDGPRTSGPVISVRRYLDICKLAPARYVMGIGMVEALFFFGAYSFVGAMLKARFDISYTLIGLTLAGYGVGGVLFIIFVGRFIRRIGQGGMVLVGALSSGVFFVVLAFVPVWQLAIPCTIGLGFSFYLLHNVMQTRSTEMAPEARGTGISLFAFFWGVGQSLGIALTGMGVAAFGFETMIALFGIGFVCLGLFLRANLHRLP
jgi:YNFM family putative membrane transporter